jgi:tetratricopeptide (TPR) repeat protein
VFKFSYQKLSLLFGGCILTGFGLWKMTNSTGAWSAATKRTESVSVSSNDACAIALAPNKGDEPIDREIRRLQDRARSGTKRNEAIKHLGWAFVGKARSSYDPGYFKLAEQCSLCLQSTQANDPDALLLQGHILDSLHQFKEAECVARKLVAIRNDASDNGLLGDVLMEQGRLDEAIISYQKMINLRPDLQAYTRIAHMRWLKGDLEGAIDVMQMAVAAGGSREPEATAWAYTRLATYKFQAGDMNAAEKSAGIALQFTENCAPALLLRGRIWLAQNKASAAIESLRQATALASLPEYQWVLADALRESGDAQAAEGVESRLVNSGAVNDARTFALYLITRGEEAQQALMLAQRELRIREDIFTMDAVAWALKANNRLTEARDYSEKSLKQGTQDARLFYHAGAIAMALGDYAKAAVSFRCADEIKQVLTPSERVALNQQFAALKEWEKSRIRAGNN